MIIDGLEEGGGVAIRLVLGLMLGSYSNPPLQYTKVLVIAAAHVGESGTHWSTHCEVVLFAQS